MRSVAFEGLGEDAGLRDKFHEIKKLAEIIKDESQAVLEHTDPQAYWECWRWLLEAMQEFQQQLPQGSTEQQES